MFLKGQLYGEHDVEEGKDRRHASQEVEVSIGRPFLWPTAVLVVSISVSGLDEGRPRMARGLQFDVCIPLRREMPIDEQSQNSVFLSSLFRLDSLPPPLLLTYYYYYYY